MVVVAAMTIEAAGLPASRSFFDQIFCSLPNSACHCISLHSFLFV